MCQVIVYIVYGCVCCVSARAAPRAAPRAGPGKDEQEPLSLLLWVEKGTRQESHAVVPVGSYGEGTRRPLRKGKHQRQSAHHVTPGVCALENFISYICNLVLKIVCFPPDFIFHLAFSPNASHHT